LNFRKSIPRVIGEGSAKETGRKEREAASSPRWGKKKRRGNDVDARTATPVKEEGKGEEFVD